jgi:non-specific serine/threonine protein kinase
LDYNPGIAAAAEPCAGCGHLKKAVDAEYKERTMPPSWGWLVYEAEGWEIDLARRQLRANGIAVPVGDRAFDIIEALVQSGGALIPKHDLMNRVWPGINVGENTLHVHISALRKALGRDRALLQTVAGRGYRLLGEWSIRSDGSAHQPLRQVEQQITSSNRANLPVGSGAGLIGRENDIGNVLDYLSAYRIVTLIGPGGIGKTRLATASAERLRADFQGDVGARPRRGWSCAASPLR